MFRLFLINGSDRRCSRRAQNEAPKIECPIENERTHLVVGRQIHYRWRPGEAVDLLLPGASRGLLAHMGGRLAIVGLVCGALSVVPQAAVLFRAPAAGRRVELCGEDVQAGNRALPPALRPECPPRTPSGPMPPPRKEFALRRPSPSPKHISQPKAHCQL